MIIILVTVFLLGLIAVNVALWKFGFVHLAANPTLVEDRPVMDAKERRAIVKRLDRWREEGKLSRDQYELFLDLCRCEWDEAMPASVAQPHKS